MDLIIFFCIFYYVFSVLFMCGYLSETDETNLWVIICGILIMLIIAPIIFPINFGKTISNTYDKW